MTAMHILPSYFSRMISGVCGSDKGILHWLRSASVKFTGTVVCCQLTALGEALVFIAANQSSLLWLASSGYPPCPDSLAITASIVLYATVCVP